MAELGRHFCGPVKRSSSAFVLVVIVVIFVVVVLSRASATIASFCKSAPGVQRYPVDHSS
jgi:hypothetical protein